MLKSFKSKANLDNSRWYMGHLFTWLVSADQTGGKFSLLELTIRRGLEPPPHVHSLESETYYILEGEMLFEIGGISYAAKAGDTLYLPVHVMHGFRLITESAKCLVLIEPGGLEEFFKEFSVPAPELSLPPLPDGPPPVELLQRFVASLETYGVTTPMEVPA